MLPDNFNCWLFCSMVDCPRLPQAQCKSIRICCHGDQAGHLTNIALYVTVVEIHTALSSMRLYVGIVVLQVVQHSWVAIGR